MHSPGELLVSAEGRVVSVGPASAGSIAGSCAAEVAIFPGLVDAHVHLQIAALPEKQPAFLPWLRQVMSQTKIRGKAQRTRACRSSVRELIASGCTAVGEIDGDGLSALVLREMPMAGRCYREVIGFDLDRMASVALVAAHSKDIASRCQGGLSPHAPYSVSKDLFAACRRTGKPTMVHVAECPEEVEFVRNGTGPFRDLLDELGRLPPRHRPFGRSPVALLDEVGLLGPDCALVHCQELGNGDRDLIRERGAPIVICPGTMHYFGRDPVPLMEWLSLGMTVALGTDSRASNSELSMLAELEQAREFWPSLSADQALAMVTTAAARAIGRPDLGKLEVGGFADFVAVELARPCDARECLEEFTFGGLGVRGTWIGGVESGGA